MVINQGQYFGVFSYLIHNEYVEIVRNKLKYFFISKYFNLLHFIEIE